MKRSSIIGLPAPKIGVAVGKGSTSVDALKWALDNENLRPSETVHLLHVYSPSQWILGFLPDTVGAEHAPVAAFDKSQAANLIGRYRSLCDEKKVKAELHCGESDAVQKELVELISRVGITRLVIGSSKTNILSRAFKGENIATYVVKHAPDVCAVTVICKGKIISASDCGSSSQTSDSNSTMMIPSPTPDWINNSPQMRRSYGRLESTRDPLLPNCRPRTDVGFHVAETTEYQDIYEASNTGNVPNNYQDQRSKCRAFSYVKQNSILRTIDDEDSMAHEIRALQNQIDQAKFSAARAMLEAEQQAKGISHADAIVANAQRIIVESERQRRDALKEAELAKRQSLENDQKCQEAIAALERASQEKEILRKECESKIDALTNMIDDYKKDVASARRQAEDEGRRCEELQKKVEELSSDLETESCRRKEAEVRAKKESAMKEEALAALRKTQRKYTEYTFRELEIATDNFHEGNKLGEGGYGPVFKGNLLDTPVAVKVLAREGVRGWQEFQKEIELLSNLHHPHLVMLLGACPERACIVYEYMSNGSLEDRLACEGGTSPLPWYVRFRICAEVASALLFLHSRPVPIVHRDMKPGNILLDHDYVSKIGDVGIAKLVSNPAFTTTMYKESTVLKGTMAYMDPDYQRTGIVTCQSDVYALGIVMLQLLTGFPAFGVADTVEDALEKKKVHEILDKEAGDWPLKEATSLATISLQCAELRKRHRPDLETVVLPILEKLRACGDRAASELASTSSTSHSSSDFYGNNTLLSSHYGNIYASRNDPFHLGGR